MAVSVALYKGRGGIGNALIRIWKHSIYSHCELLIDGRCFSSTVMDGGVRAKTITLRPEQWDVIPVRGVDAVAVLRYFARTAGQPYSWWGLLVSQVFATESDEPRAAFCSEWCAAALGIPDPQIYSPGTLGELIKYLNERVG